jgi:alkylated DNA repair dioxygenase AlkB
MEELEAHDLGDGHTFRVARLPGDLGSDPALFESLWQLHPADFHEIVMGGRKVKTPRWQQAFGADYRYSGTVNRALPLPPPLLPLLDWARQQIDARLNAVLMNWYDASLGHYMGRHRDSIGGMIRGAPIITISFGEARVFRLRPLHGAGHKDFPACDRSVFIMPYETNRAWTHEVPRARKYTGRRISVTLRAFEPAHKKEV